MSQKKGQEPKPEPVEVSKVSEVVKSKDLETKAQQEAQVESAKVVETTESTASAPVAPTKKRESRSSGLGWVLVMLAILILVAVLWWWKPWSSSTPLFPPKPDNNYGLLELISKDT